MARASRAVWAKRVRRWADSDLSAAEFAAQTGVNARTLAYWKWRLGSERGRGAARTAVGARFVEVIAATAVGEAASPARRDATASDGAAEPLVLLLRGGRRLRIPARFDDTSLRRVLAVLEGH